MPQVKEIKKRIAMVKNIGHITKAMKTMATAKIRRLDATLKKTRIYDDKLKELVLRLTSYSDFDPSKCPLITEREVKRELFIILTADTGFCGSFNYNVIRAAMEKIRGKKAGEDFFVIALGKKIISALARRRIPLEMSIPRWKPDFDTAGIVIDKCTAMFEAGQIDRVTFIYGKAGVSSGDKAAESVLIPAKIDISENTGNERDLIIEPSPIEVLNNILPYYLKEQVFRMFLETRTGELEARIRSMSNATENAESLADELTIQFFRARQESITREIIEVTSGAKSAAH